MFRGKEIKISALRIYRLHHRTEYSEVTKNVVFVCLQPKYFHDMLSDK